MLTFKTIHWSSFNLDSFSTLSFRTIDGSNNNLINPTFNSTGSDTIRIAPAHFAPGTTNTRIEGPNPREISNVVSSGPQAETTDPTGLSAMMYAWGQFIDHDHTLPDGTNNIDITIPSGDPNLRQPADLFL
jgi:peroxidase